MVLVSILLRLYCTMLCHYSKTCVKRPLSKRPEIGFQDQLLLNAGQKYCRMLQGEHSAILSTFIKLLFVIKIVVLSIFQWPLKTGFTVISEQSIINGQITSTNIRRSNKLRLYNVKYLHTISASKHIVYQADIQ